MLAYIIRRILLTIPIVLGVVVITLVLFSYVSKDPARAYAGRMATPEVLEAVRHKMGIDKPRWFKLSTPVRSMKTADGSVNVTTQWSHGLAKGDDVTIKGLGDALDGTFKVQDTPGEKTFTYRPAAPATPPEKVPPAASVQPASIGSQFTNFFDSQFFDILTFNFKPSMRWGDPLWTLVKRKAPASMTIQVPTFIIELGLQLSLALFVAFNRGRWQDYTITFLAVLGMSVPALSIYILAQWLLGQIFPVFPVAGWESGIYAIHFAALPILLSVIMGMGGGVRFYRTVMLEEVNQDYVRTARAKGLPYREILFTHVLRNAFIPVLTNVVTALPGLILGALLLERIFQIPGLGNLMVDALNNNDLPVVMGMTYILSIVYCILLLLTDICYAVADPRVSLK